MSSTCLVCKNPVEKCLCCPECGHVCPLDWGQTYCPISSTELKQEK